MAQEQKAKAYDGNYKAYTELINRLEDVKDAIKKQNYGIAMDILCKPYPEFQITTHSELKESEDSEDESIRKKLLLSFKCVMADADEDELWYGLSYNDIIVWLEKQGKNNMGISESTKQKLEDNLNYALEKETPESCNKFLDEQGMRKDVEFPTKIVKGNTYLCVKELKFKESPLGAYAYFKAGSFYKCKEDFWLGDEHNCRELIDGDKLNYFILVKESIGKVEPKFKVKYAGSESNVLEVKDIAGVAFYGIEDEPNHIDYVKAENCEIISGYGIKENGSPYPTKPAVFSEQNIAWSEEDEKMIQDIINDIAIAQEQVYCKSRCEDEINWLKSIKDRYAWKLSEEQMASLEFVIKSLDRMFTAIGYMDNTTKPRLEELLKQLKKLKEE